MRSFLENILIYAISSIKITKKPKPEEHHVFIKIKVLNERVFRDCNALQGKETIDDIYIAYIGFGGFRVRQKYGWHVRYCEDAKFGEDYIIDTAHLV